MVPADPAAFIPIWVDITAAVLGGIVGALAAARARFDINGALILAIVTGLGGGIVRDLLLCHVPVALTSPWLLPVAVVVGILTFVFSRQIDAWHGRLGIVMIVLDAVFLAEYTVVGTAKAIESGLPIVSCILLGATTGVGGGVLRDVLLRRPPLVLRPGTFEATAAVVGALVQSLLALLVSPWIAAIVGFVVVVVLRLLSVFRRWETPPARIAAPEADLDDAGRGGA